MDGSVDPAAATVTSFVPVGNDPLPLALSDDGSALWVGLAGERRVRRMTPGSTPVPGPAYTLPKLLTTGESVVPVRIVVLPGTPASIASTALRPPRSEKRWSRDTLCARMEPNRSSRRDQNSCRRTPRR